MWSYYYELSWLLFFFFFFQAEDGIRDRNVTGVQTCALPIFTRALKLQEKAGEVGFDWNDARAVLAKIREEAEEIAAEIRSEERRVGKECRSRWWPDQ